MKRLAILDAWCTAARALIVLMVWVALLLSLSPQI